jgi:hypothetical protein
MSKEMSFLKVAEVTETVDANPYVIRANFNTAGGFPWGRLANDMQNILTCKTFCYKSNIMDLQLKGEILGRINSLKKYIHDMADKMKKDQIAAQKGKDPNRTPPSNYTQITQVLTIQKIIHWIDRTNDLLDEKSSDFIDQIKENLNTIKTLLNDIPKAPGFYTPTPEQVTHITTEIDVIMQQL